YLTVCADRGSPRETSWIIACRAGEIEIADVRALASALTRVNAARAYLVSEAPVLPTVRDEARTTTDRVRACTLDAFYRELADFTPYAQYLVQQWEREPLSQYYVDLGGKRQQRDQDGKPVGEGDPYKPIDDYLDRWLDVPGGNHISILGDYGTGKTTLVKQYAAKLARRYLAQPDRSRIPILISLRDYAKAMNLRQLITDFIVNEQRERVRLDGAYAAFEQLNCDGKFILIFDGFDEMARQVSYQTTVNNFDELAKAAEGDAKVLLTCRKHYFHEAREERSVLSGEASARWALERGDAARSAEHPGGKDEPGIVLRAGFETVYLDEFTPADITLLLQKRFPARWQEFDARIRTTYNLTDLAKRPVLLDMIVQTLDAWGARKITNAAQLYQVCTKRWMERDIQTGRAFLNENDKRVFSEELAVEVFRTGQLTGIHHSQFPAIIKKHFSRL
ncbi:MAG: NACHT domain-containing protein, partial [Anaerolineales bacterium]|nr:NACHT domain-containing protein [Anaerolineales bacterium]